MAFEYYVTITEGSTLLMNAIVGGSTTPDITYFYDVTDNPSNTTNILYENPLGNRTDGTKFIDTHISSFPNLLTPSTYYILRNNGTNNVVVVSNDLENELTVTLQFSDISCFNEGTKILCLKHKKDKYVPIEQLRKGDIVKTYKYGYRRIDLIGKNCLWNNPENFSHCMYKMEKTEKNGLLEDLIVTGGHSILVDDLGECKEYNEQLFHGTIPMIENKYLLLAAASNEFVQITDSNKYTYYHLVLENNDEDDERFGIWANGILTETPSKKYFIQSHFRLL
jgi:hypothetical protein